MIRLLERTREEGIAHHQANPVRVYADGGVQQIRIDKSRAVLQRAVSDQLSAVSETNGQPTILELGCGTGDISGPFAERNIVVGVDCHRDALKEAERRFPGGMFVWDHLDSSGSRGLGIEKRLSLKPNVVVLCEVLEHIQDPEGLVRRWLPLAGQSVISHPLDEPLGSGLSGGDHCWSFSEADFLRWFDLGGHKVMEYEKFPMGGYTILLGRGRRKESH